MKQKILVYDLETTSTNPQTAIPRIMGFYSSEVDGFRWTTSIGEMIRIINDHDVIVGYNSISYDNVIMNRYGADTFYKINVDCMKIIHGDRKTGHKGWINSISLKDGTHLPKVLHSASLEATAKVLGAPLKIADFDYSVFQKEFALHDEETRDKILEYLKADLDATKFIYEFLEDYFHNNGFGGVEIDGEFKYFMTAEQKRKKIYLTASTASWAYKVLCNLAGIEERYGDKEHTSYGGGFVAEPEFEKAEGNIYCLDYNSLYPHIMVMMNLYGSTPDGKKGQGLAFTEGLYDSERLSRVSELIKKFYDLRLYYKSIGDSRQYTIKIIINTLYGLLGNETFASVANSQAAADCTRLGRQFVKAARLHFKEHGYKVLYTDTDSVYVQDVFNNKKKLLEVKDKHIADIKSQVFFPVDTFDMGIDAEIDFIHFFKNRNKSEFLKKHYLYIKREKDGSKSLQIVGMALVKSDCTALSKYIFNKFIKPEILNNHRVKFPKSDIENWIYDALQEDMTLATKFFKVKEPSSYSVDTQIWPQIAMCPHYGPGEYHMWKLNQPHPKGAGIRMNYVSTKFIDEVKLHMLDLSKTMKELDPFIQPQQKSLGEFI